MRTEYVRPEYLLPLIGYNERLGNMALPVLTILFVALLLFPSSCAGLKWLWPHPCDTGLIRATEKTLGHFYLTSKQTEMRVLGPVEDASRLFFLSFFSVVSSSCPCLFRVETGVTCDGFCLPDRVFREAGSAVDWFAWPRLEGHSGRFAAVRAFDFIHSFLLRVQSPLLAFGQ